MKRIINSCMSISIGILAYCLFWNTTNEYSPAYWGGSNILQWIIIVVCLNIALFLHIQRRK
jgi:hypothetical protein